MYQTVIFDLDGTVLDTIADLTAAANDVCRENGWREYSAAEIRAMVGHGMENFIKALSPADAQSPDRRAATLDRFRDFYRDCLTIRTRPYPGMADLVDRLHADGVKLAVCSNKDHAFCVTLMDTFYPGKFSVVLGKRPGVPPKPDPASVREILRTLDAEPSRTLYAGDSATDVRTGHNAGLPVCAVTWGYRPQETLVEAGPEFLAETPAELGTVLRGGPGTAGQM